jgi:transcription antitermination factor NusG
MAGKDWYGVRVRPKGEARASSELSIRGFEAFLPTRRIRRRWSDRVKTLEVPVFPGYLFCRFLPEERVKVLDAPAVIQILGIGATPTPVSDSEIEALQTMVTSHLMLTPWPYLRSGQHIRIGHGPLAGIDGIVTEAQDGNPRVVVSVTLLQRSIATEIERDWIG